MLARKASSLYLDGFNEDPWARALHHDFRIIFSLRSGVEGSGGPTSQSNID